MHSEAFSESGQSINSMWFQRIEVQCILNWYANFNAMAEIADLLDFDIYLYSQKLYILNYVFL